MININLLEKKKPFRAPIVLGMDLNSISWKSLIVTIVLVKVAEWVIYPNFTTELEEIRKEKEVLQQKITMISNKVRANKSIKEKLTEYKKQVDRLTNRSAQVDKIIKEKRSPKLILERMARAIPDDMWFDKITLGEDSLMTLEGGGISYRSIGDFIVSAKKMGFFGDTIKLDSSETIEDKTMGFKVRVQQFKITGKVLTFNPWKK